MLTRSPAFLLFPQASVERSSTGLDVDDPLRGRSRSDASGSAKGKGKVRRGAHRVMEMMGVGANNNGEDSKRSIRQAAECLMQLVAKAHNNIISGKYVTHSASHVPPTSRLTIPPCGLQGSVGVWYDHRLRRSRR